MSNLTKKVTTTTMVKSPKRPLGDFSSNKRRLIISFSFLSLLRRILFGLKICLFLMSYEYVLMASYSGNGLMATNSNSAISGGFFLEPCKHIFQIVTNKIQIFESVVNLFVELIIITSILECVIS